MTGTDPLNRIQNSCNIILVLTLVEDDSSSEGANVASESTILSESNAVLSSGGTSSSSVRGIMLSRRSRSDTGIGTEKLPARISSDGMCQSYISQYIELIYILADRNLV